MNPVVLYHTEHAKKTRREILLVAVDIASAEGLENLSIGRLAKELRMSKTGIFAHFGSKQQLQLATVDAASEIFLQQVVQPVLQIPQGLRRLRAMLESWLGYIEQSVFRGGCFFAAVSAEFDSRPGKVRDNIAALTKAWVVALQDEIALATANGELLRDVNQNELAFELHAYVQEANWAFKMFNDRSAFMLAKSAIANRIDRAVNPGSIKPSRKLRSAK